MRILSVEVQIDNELSGLYNMVRARA